MTNSIRNNNQQIKKPVAVACAKLILVGEHAAVAGFPALAIPMTSLNLKAQISKEKNIQQANIITKIFDKNQQTNSAKIKFKIISNIPQKSGLGSSAAFATAVIRALYNYHHLTYTKKQLFKIVQQCETVYHGKPSGLDAATVIYQQPVLLKNNKTTCISIHDQDINKIVLINSGQATESTKEMIGHVSKNLHKNKIFNQLGLLCQQYLENSITLKQLFYQAHQLLNALGVVGDRAKQIISQIEKIGGAAKISGAGGRKTGSGIIAAYHQDKNILVQLCKNNNYQLIN
ncbi:MAG: hypothetical protein GF390_03165 [Candidatus Pacebacteria bacterium]|nr:hypothetical protein [Candidatus Paceibacterota bacterium]